MAVKVIVCGDENGDYEFLVAAANRKRIFNEEIFELVDDEGNLLYTVPIHSLRLMQLFPVNSEEETKIQKYQPDNSITSICFNNGNNKDAIVECTTANSDRFVNEVIVESHNFLGKNQDGSENWIKEFIIPLKHIKFINHNHILPETSNKIPKAETNTEIENEINEEIVEVQENIEQPTKKQKHRFKK